MSLLSFKNKNPLRNFVKNVRSVVRSDKDGNFKIALIKSLYQDLSEKDNLKSWCHRHPSLNEKFNYDWWNLRANVQNQVPSFLKSSYMSNPWWKLLDDMDMLEEIPGTCNDSQSDTLRAIRHVETSLAWFYHDPWREDWAK